MKNTIGKVFGIKFFWLLMLCGFSSLSHAQYTIIGQNAFGGTNFYGPMTTNGSSDTFFSRHAYIYPAATLDQLKDGDTIRSIEFFKSGFNRYNGNPNFKIYLSMSTAADFGAGNIHWPKEAAKTGTVKVFEGDPTNIADSTTGFKRFDFNTGLFVFDTSKGSHLKILVEYTQTTRQIAAVAWVYENDFSVPSFISNNETKYVTGAGLPVDSTNGSNLRKPYIKINHPLKNNLEVNKIYCLGRVPTLMNRADSITSLIVNTGLNTVYNHKIYLSVTGANQFKDSIILDSLRTYESAYVVFGSHKPVNLGIETIKVFVGKDDYSFDDEDSVRRIVDYNVYSHADPFTGNAPGGIGFNNSSGDFVAKFYTDSAIYINQIKVDFDRGGQGFQLGIWQEDNNGLPGKLIFTSDTLTSVAGTYILPVLPRVKIDSGYFVGIRQTGTVNVAFAFQFESPIRPNTFYFAAPMGDTAWVPFAPGFDFKFNIQPRIQVGNDVAVLRMDYPSDGDTIEYSQYDSIAPSATVVNYGFNDQKAPFDVICEITDQFGRQVYGDTVSITLNGNDTVTITFAKRMSLNNYGQMSMRVYTKLHSDKVLDNDTLIQDFFIVVKYDIAVENYFDPFEGQKFELNSSRVGPVVRIANFGASNQSNIQVTSRIRQGNKISRTQTKAVNLTGSGSVIVSFDSFTIPWWGDVVFECYVWNKIDSFPSNDTFRVNVYVDKSHDVGIVNISKPVNDGRYERKSVFQPYVNIRNFGVKDQDAVPVYAEITNLSGKIIYTDTMSLPVVKFSTSQALMKKFTVPDTVQRLKFRVITQLSKDQDKSNDTAIAYFNIVSAKDLSVSMILEPENNKVYNQSTNFTPKAIITNLGNASVAAPPVFYCTIKNEKGDVLYLDSATILAGLGIDKSDTLIFSKSYLAEIKGVYTCKIWHKWNLDNLKSNDTLISNFEISYLKSVKAVSLDIPVNNKIYEFNDAPLFPRVTLKNDGLENIYSGVHYTLTIGSGSQVLYNQNGKFDTLFATVGKSIIFSTPFPLDKIGEMWATFIVDNSEDIYHANDTIRSTFRVVKNFDVSADMVLFPAIDSTIYVNRLYAPKARFSNLGDSAISNLFRVTYLVYENSKIIYSSNRNILMDKGETRDITFDSTFMALDKGSYSSMAIVRLGNDQDVTNDTAVGTFYATYFASVPNLDNVDYTISPNPAQTEISISTQKQISQNNIRFFNALGKEVYPVFLKGNDDLKYDVSNLISGLYSIEIKDESGVFIKKMIIY